MIICLTNVNLNLSKIVLLPSASEYYLDKVEGNDSITNHYNMCQIHGFPSIPQSEELLPHIYMPLFISTGNNSISIYNYKSSFINYYNTNLTVNNSDMIEALENYINSYI